MKKIVIATLVSTSLMAAPLSQAATNVNSLVAKKAAVINSLHKKAKKALVNAAQDSSYKAFLAADSGARHEHEHRINEVSLSVQKKFHVEEMCLIDASGPELARIVGDKVASDLSADESSAVFFAPGFSQKPRTAYISPVYMSPDADKWVLAYVTPVLVGKDKKAILHYEHGLDVYQAVLNKDVKGARVVAVSADGYVISDSDAAVGVSKTGDKEEQADYFAPFQVAGLDVAAAKAEIKSSKSLAGQKAAFKEVSGWTLFAISK